jgi:7-keto-8-aminopelargonate synthetase-like enzyme
MSVITTEKETQISFDYALAQQIVQLNIQDEALDGRMITVNGCPMINFGNCSYLGLELHPAIKAGVMLMTQRYGSLYASSRSYVGLGIFEELEDLMEQIFGGPTLMATCTTMGHLGVIPVLVGPHDVVIMDQQVHASVQMAVSCLKGSNPAQQVEKIKHNNLAMLENRIQKLSVGNNKIWYMVDGVYSMFGDVAPIPEILELMDRYDNLYLYCDDAHGMSWTGRHGAGFFRSRCAYHPRVVLSTSLGKGFGAAGGTFTFPNQEMKHKVRSLGGTFIFAAPLSPPLLGLLPCKRPCESGLIIL